VADGSLSNLIEDATGLSGMVTTPSCDWNKVGPTSDVHPKATRRQHSRWPGGDMNRWMAVRAPPDLRASASRAAPIYAFLSQYVARDSALEMAQPNMSAMNGLARIRSGEQTAASDLCARICLFARIGLVLPIQSSPGLSERVRAHLCGPGGSEARTLPFMVVSCILTTITPFDFQLSLPLSPPRRPNVVRLVPPLRRAFLDYGVYDQFYDLPGAAKAALKLEENGIFLLGQLLQMSDDAILAFPFMNETILETMKKDLARFDLSFGMRHPAWNRRYRSVFAVSL
jgi:hypothetical protein